MRKALSVDDQLYYLREFEHIVFVRLLIAEHKTNGAEQAISDATRLLHRLLQAAEAGQRVGSVLQILVMQALVHEAQSDIASARELLERALSLAEPEGHVRLFVDEGLPMAQLLSALAAPSIMPDYVERLLGVFTAEGVVGSDNLRSIAESQLLVDPLSERELEILTHIAAGLKNKEIAAALFVSINTVSLSHQKHLQQTRGQ